MSAALIIIILFAVLIVVKQSINGKINGAIGELKVSGALRLLDQSRYKVINDVVLNIGNSTTQIDHIVISDYGVFVIETKNYKGFIIGNEKRDYWVQFLYSKKEQLYNPIKQNAWHIKAIQNLLIAYPNLKFHSIIVFTSKANVQVKRSSESEIEIVNEYQLISTIKKHKVVHLSEQEKQNIYNKIIHANIKDSYDEGEHVRKIQERIATYQQRLLENKCPKCSSELVSKKGKYGEFLGCSAYPRCNYTRNHFVT